MQQPILREQVKEFDQTGFRSEVALILKSSCGGKLTTYKT